MSDAPDTLIIEFDPPIAAKGGEVAQIVLTEPRARHVRDAEKRLDLRLSEGSVTEYEMTLVRLTAGVDEAVVEAMPARKLGEAANWLQGFISDGFHDVDDDRLDDLPAAEFEVAIEPAITWLSISYPALTLREPTADQVRKSRSFTRERLTPYTARCRDMELLRLVTGLHPAVIDGLRIRTLTEATRALARFIVAGRRGATRSSSG